MDPEYELSQLIDGDLPDDQRARLQADLRSDAQLSEAYRQFARLDALIREAAPPLPDVDWPALRREVSAAIEKAPPPRRPRPSLSWRWVGAAVAAALGFLVLAWPDAGPRKNAMQAPSGVEVAFLEPVRPADTTAWTTSQRDAHAIVQFERAADSRAGGRVAAPPKLLVVTLSGFGGSGRTAAGPGSQGIE